MPLFDLHACLDYSGARSRTAQRKHIVLAIAAKTRKTVKIVTNKDRREMGDYLLAFLRQSADDGRRVLLGIDHNFGFPCGFYESLTGYPLDNWRQWLDLLHNGPLSLKITDGDPRNWAEMINRIMQVKYGLSCGPFWGPGFSVPVRPDFKYAQVSFEERRLIEQRIPGTQPVFKLGGAGAVGLQSLHGICQLAVLTENLGRTGIPVFFWPFDGFDPPPDRHVLVEIYPGILNPGIKSDRNDAESGARWLQETDHLGKLAGLLHYSGRQNMLRQIRAEGWIPGVFF